MDRYRAEQKQPLIPGDAAVDIGYGSTNIHFKSSSPQPPTSLSSSQGITRRSVGARHVNIDDEGGREGGAGKCAGNEANTMANTKERHCQHESELGCEVLDKDECLRNSEAKETKTKDENWQIESDHLGLTAEAKHDSVKEGAADESQEEQKKNEKTVGLANDDFSINKLGICHLLLIAIRHVCWLMVTSLPSILSVSAIGFGYARLPWTRSCPPIPSNKTLQEKCTYFNSNVLFVFDDIIRSVRFCSLVRRSMLN